MNNPLGIFKSMTANNPVMQLLSIVRGGGNPMALIQQMAGQSPQVAQALKMIQGKNTAQLQQMANNMASERGINLNEMAKQLGINLPK